MIFQKKCQIKILSHSKIKVNIVNESGENFYVLKRQEFQNILYKIIIWQFFFWCITFTQTNQVFAIPSSKTAIS